MNSAAAAPIQRGRQDRHDRKPKHLSHARPAASGTRATEKTEKNSSLKKCLGFNECRTKPFDFTQGHESFDYAQDPEVLEGRRRMACLFHHSLTTKPACALHGCLLQRLLSEHNESSISLKHHKEFTDLPCIAFLTLRTVPQSGAECASTDREEGGAEKERWLDFAADTSRVGFERHCSSLLSL